MAIMQQARENRESQCVEDASVASVVTCAPPLPKYVLVVSADVLWSHGLSGFRGLGAVCTQAGISLHQGLADNRGCSPPLLDARCSNAPVALC